MKRFTLTDDHVKLLRAANVRWEDCEAGAPAVDCKRPYGNSDVEHDIARILGWELFEDTDGEHHLTREQDDQARALHEETLPALAVILAVGTFEPGTYEADDYRNNWRPA